MSYKIDDTLVDLLEERCENGDSVSMVARKITNGNSLFVRVIFAKMSDECDFTARMYEWGWKRICRKTIDDSEAFADFVRPQIKSENVSEM